MEECGLDFTEKFKHFQVNEVLKSELEAEKELSSAIENLGERHTVWLKVKSEREDLRDDSETANFIEEHVSVFVGWLTALYVIFILC